MSVKLNILKNTGAGIFSKGSNFLIRLLQVPLLIHFLGVENFGRWIVLYTIPSWLTFTNLGFGSAGANQISMLVADGNEDDARKVFSTTVAIITLIAVLGSIFCIIVSPLIRWEVLLKTDTARHAELKFSVILLCLTTFFSFYNEAFLGVYRAAHKTHYAMLLTSLLPWLNLLGMYFVLSFTTRFDLIALSLLITNLLFTLVYATLSSRAMPDLRFSFKLVQPKSFKYLFRKGFAFQAFPVGNALVIQGNVLIVQFLLGPAAVALYSTAKTLVNTIRQGMDIIAQATWPELSHLIGANNLKLAAVIHQKSVSISIILSLAGIIILAIWGNFFYSIWVGKTLELSFNLLLLFIIPMPFLALWFTSSVVHLASNKHEGLAVRYIIAALISLAFSLVLTYSFGVGGTAISIIAMDIILIPYVVNYSLKLTNDNWVGFISGMYNFIKNIPSLVIK